MVSHKPEKYSFGTEVVRKLVHLNGIYLVLLYEFFGQRFTLGVLTVALVVALEAEYFRIEWGRNIPLCDVLVRQKEEKVLGGHVFLGIGAIIVISVFSKEVAQLAILMTVVGDAAAAIFGRAYGKHFIPGLKGKAIEGVFAEFVCDIIVGIVYFVLFFEGVWGMWWVVLVVMAVSATVTETISGKMDDNLLVPVFCGFTGEMLVVLLGIASIVV